MKKLLFLLVFIPLVFGCDEQLTIDVNSDEYQYLKKSEKRIVNYKGTPFNGTNLPPPLAL